MDHSFISILMFFIVFSYLKCG